MRQFYRPGHTWALSESRELVRVGIDDFASKLVGKIESIALPQRGRWVRQGQKICTIFRNGKSVDMVSPIEGTVSDVNEGVAKDPSLALKDPYGEGWIVTVQAPDSKINFRNLLGGTLARMWTEDSAFRLRKRMPVAMAAALAQDGGVAVDDITAHLPNEDWAVLPKSSSFRRPRTRIGLAQPPVKKPPGKDSGRFFINQKLRTVAPLSHWQVANENGRSRCRGRRQH